MREFRFRFVSLEHGCAMFKTFMADSYSAANKLEQLYADSLLTNWNFSLEV